MGQYRRLFSVYSRRTANANPFLTFLDAPKLHLKSPYDTDMTVLGAFRSHIGRGQSPGFKLAPNTAVPLLLKLGSAWNLVADLWLKKIGLVRRKTRYRLRREATIHGRSSSKAMSSTPWTAFPVFLCSPRQNDRPGDSGRQKNLKKPKKQHLGIIPFAIEPKTEFSAKSRLLSY